MYSDEDETRLRECEKFRGLLEMDLSREES